MQHKIIETEWQKYVEKVLPPFVAPETVQYKETRKAFYAGAGCLLAGILGVLGPGHEATESDLSIMDGIQEELDEFVKSVSRT